MRQLVFHGPRRLAVEEADPLPVGRRFFYLLNNVFGLALDRLLPAENLIVNYVVVAEK